MKRRWSLCVIVILLCFLSACRNFNEYNPRVDVNFVIELPKKYHTEKVIKSKTAGASNNLTVQLKSKDGNIIKEVKRNVESSRTNCEVVFEEINVGTIIQVCANFEFSSIIYTGQSEWITIKAGINEINLTLSSEASGEAEEEEEESSETAYYVSANGNNSKEGTLDNPFKTLTHAITRAVSNNINKIYVMGTLNASSEGYSSGAGSSVSNSAFYIQDSNVGSSGNHIIIEGYGENPTLSADYDSGESNVRLLATKNDCYITMKNLTFTDGTTTGSGGAIYYYGGELTLDNCKIENNNSDSNDVSNVSYDVYLYGSATLNMINTTCTDGIYVYNSIASLGTGCVIGVEEATDSIIHNNLGNIKLNGDVLLHNPIYTDNSDSILVTSTLTSHSNENKVSLILKEYEDGFQIIDVSEGLTLANECQKFELSNADYAISDEGKVVSASQ